MCSRKVSIDFDRWRWIVFHRVQITTLKSILLSSNFQINSFRQLKTDNHQTTNELFICSAACDDSSFLVDNKLTCSSEILVPWNVFNS